jgi:predicted naringenin-chalcone synthase
MNETNLSRSIAAASKGTVPSIIENEKYSALSTGMKFWVVFPGGKSILARDMETAQFVIATNEEN